MRHPVFSKSMCITLVYSTIPCMQLKLMVSCMIKSCFSSCEICYSGKVMPLYTCIFKLNSNLETINNVIKMLSFFVLF